MHYRFPLTISLALALVGPGCGPKPAPTTPPVTEAPAPVDPIPEGFFTLTPQLTVQGVDAAVDFYVAAFGAEKLFALPGLDGKTAHAEIKIGDSIVMLDEEMLEQGMRSPLALGGTPATLMIYLEDADVTYAAAVEAGATAEMPIAEQFWGDRYGQLIDPFGHRWALATHVVDLSPEQMQQRAALAQPPPSDKKKKGKKEKGKKGDPPWMAIEGSPATAPVPEPYHTVTISLTTDDAAAAIEFYKTAFGATERDRMADGNGKLLHAELAIGDSTLMLSDEFPEMGGTSAKTLGGSPVGIFMYSDDVDVTVATATESGASAAMPITDMFWGDRYGVVVGVAGYVWGVATHTEDVPPEEIEERMKAQLAAQPATPDATAAPDAAAAPEPAA